MTPARSGPREYAFSVAKANLQSQINILTNQTFPLANKTDVLAYQTGAAKVANLTTLKFFEGSYADHLTSYGGVIYSPKQMPVTEFIKAGATAGYGTVREPCNFSFKFPAAEAQLKPYLRGDTIMEAYWKGVGWSTEGLFVGEPLARPFTIVDVVATSDNKGLILRANRLSSGALTGSTYDVFDVTSGTPVKLLSGLSVTGRLKAGTVLATVKTSTTSARTVLALAPTVIATVKK